MNDSIDREMKNIRRLDEERLKAHERLQALQGNPRTVNMHDPKAVSENLEGLASGSVVAVNENRKKRELKSHEIDIHDQKAVNANLAAIANGTKVIADPYEPAVE